MSEDILEIALPTPLRRHFDYLIPNDTEAKSLQPGLRLQVPFGKRTLTGVLLRLKPASNLPREQLKRAHRVLDTEPVLDETMLKLTQWAASYYFHSPGEAIFNALPPTLRKGNSTELPSQKVWHLHPLAQGLGDAALRGAPRQKQAVQYLLSHQSVNQAELAGTGLSRDALQALVAKGLATTALEAIRPASTEAETSATPKLSDEQAHAVVAITAGLGQFRTYLLQGVTGSGKTEVYLNAIKATLSQQRQALVLVPEIGLTPQTIARFQARFGNGVVAIHSRLGDNERLAAWNQARNGQASVIIGTRSAIFAPCSALGLIIVDEEHDTSYKQQHGICYSARDVAVKRAQLQQIPIVLGSATPASESLYNTAQGRYSKLSLTHRAGNAVPPEFELVDMRAQKLREGFCEQTLDALEQNLTAGNQSLVFINRRGFAPTLICHACGWVAECRSCDARLVVHRRQHLLKCHHCEAQQAIPASCPTCGSNQLQGLGLGTERTEAFLQARFKHAPVIRIDRDSTRTKGSLDAFIERIHSGEPAILVGTQMLAKGHHFPDVTLVAVMDADAGLCSADFRGPERTAQMLMQVAGRAGRAEKPGQVLIQTHNPDHVLLQLLCKDQYPELSELILNERQHLMLPPFGHLAAIRCSCTNAEAPGAVLTQLREALGTPNGLTAIGPLSPALAKLAGRYRSQLLLKHEQREALHRSLKQAVTWLEGNPRAKRLRWSVDVDPQDLV